MQVKKLKLKRKTKENLVGYSFIGIWLIGFLVFLLYPLLNSIIYALSDVSLSGTGILITFKGFKNFTSLFKIEQGFIFLEALGQFALELVFQVPIIIVFSILIAVLLNQPLKGRGIFRTIFFLPVIISSGPVINELISQGAGGQNIMDTYGFISIIENNLNPKLAAPIISLFSEIIIIFWFSGVQILIMLSGLKKIDKQVYEAARVDGAGPWQTFWKITLPALSPLIFVNIIYTIVILSTFSENQVIASIRSNMFNFQTGYGIASAMSWMYAMMILLVIGIISIFFLPKKRRA